METRTYTPDELIKLAAEGRFTKSELAAFLAIDSRKPFLEACAQIERQYTVACGSKGDTCLDAGCSAKGEACLEPLLHAGSAYHKDCAGAWLPYFRDPKNRA